MSEGRKALLTVYDDYTVDFYGRRLGLSSTLQSEMLYPGHSYAEYFEQRQRYRISFEVFEPRDFPTPPAPKTSWTARMGLRRPK